MTQQTHTEAREGRIASFRARHDNYLTRAAAAPAGKPQMLFFFCPVCSFGFFETWELSHHAPDCHGHQALWEPLCPVCSPSPNGPPRMVQLTGHRSKDFWNGWQPGARVSEVGATWHTGTVLSVEGVRVRVRWDAGFVASVLFHQIVEAK